MPFLLDMSSRAIAPTIQLHGDINEWVIAEFHIKKLLNDQNPHELDWEDVTIRGLLNVKDDTLILQDRGAAFDIEYWTRGGGILDWSLVKQLGRQPVDYSDIDFPAITDKMYAANILHDLELASRN